MILHGQFKVEIYTKDVKGKVTSWLRRGDLKRTIKSLIIAAQDQTLAINAIKRRIQKTSIGPKCWL